jgi:hypothetical protein
VPEPRLERLRSIPRDKDGWVLPNPDVDMEEYDRKLVEMGFVFEDDPEDEDEDEVTLTFLAEPEAPTKP